MEADRRDIHRSAKVGTVTREMARDAVLAVKTAQADKSGSDQRERVSRGGDASGCAPPKRK